MTALANFLQKYLKINPFLAVVATLMVLVYGYLGHGLISPLGITGPLAFAPWIALIAPFGVILWLPLVYWRLDEPDERHTPVLWAAFGSMATLSFLIFYSALRDLLLGGARLMAWVLGSGDAWIPHSLEGSRGTSLVLALAGTSLLLGFRGARRAPEITRTEVRIEGLPEALAGLKIAQISDLHISSTIRKPFVERVVRAVNDLEPDLIALTGDLVDGTVAQLRDPFQALAALQAPLGRFYVTGNHEYYWEHEAWIEHARRCGLTPLVNSHAVVVHGGARVVVAGVLDYWATRNGGSIPTDPVAALAGAPSDAGVRILLAHQPKSALQAAPLGYDLQLSGHTHGGQFLPWTMAVKGFQPFVRGLYQVGRMWLYVNRGTGYWGPPVRLGSASEISLLTLRRA